MISCGCGAHSALVLTLETRAMSLDTVRSRSGKLGMSNLSFLAIGRSTISDDSKSCVLRILVYFSLTIYSISSRFLSRVSALSLL